MTPEERVQQGGRIRRADPSAVSAGIRQRRRRRLAPLAVHDRLLRHVDRRDARRALRQSVPDRPAHRAGRRARLVHRRLAGGRGDLGARCDRPHCISARSRRAAQDMSAAGSQPTIRRAARRALLAIGAASGTRADDSAFDARLRPRRDASGEEIYSQSARAATCRTAKARSARDIIRSSPAIRRSLRWHYVALTVLGGRNGMPAFGAAADQVREARTAASDRRADRRSGQLRAQPFRQRLQGPRERAAGSDTAASDDRRRALTTLRSAIAPRSGAGFQERTLGGAQRVGDAARPLRLAGAVLHQVLAYLDLDMRQAARLAMVRDGVVGLIADEIGLVVGDDADPRSRRSISSTSPAKRRSRLYSTAACISRRTPLKMSVMLC